MRNAALVRMSARPSVVVVHRCAPSSRVAERRTTTTEGRADMRTKAAFLIGGVVGYVLGTRAGREQFDKIRTQAQKLGEDPRVQSTVNDVEQRATTLMKEKGPELK